jgi:Flp pilus assembly protein TadD
MDSLRDESLSPAERGDAYRASLASAEQLLIRSIRTQPAQAWTLAKLAAVRWELEPSLEAGAMARHLELIRLSSSMAPTDPDVQVDLGRLLLLTGRRDEGAELLSLAVELSPTMAREVVDLMVQFLFDPREILETLPRSSATLVALREPFIRAGRGSEYVEILGPALAAPEIDAAVLRSFGETCVRVGEPRRALDILVALGALEAPGLEAERSVQVAWARLSLGDVGGSLADADRARALMPGSERYREQAGMIALRAGRPDLAVEDFRAALSFAARGDAPPERRGTLYRRIGQALDKQGKADLAYDAYKRALTLAPGESHAARRVHEMEQASGMRR